MKSGKKVKYYLLFYVILTLISYPYYAFSTTYMEKGELTELSFPTGSKFVLTNKRVLSAHVIEEAQKIIIKSKSSGRCTLIILPPEKPTRNIEFFVSNPENSISMASIMAKLRSINLKFKRIGKSTLEVKNQIKNRENYFELVKIYKQKNHSIEIKAELSKKLKKEILVDLYLEFLRNDIDSVNCDNEGLIFHCTVDKSEDGIIKISALTKQRFLLKIEKIDMTANRSYSIHIKIVQFEKSQSHQVDGGINNFELSIQDALKNNFETLLQDKKIFLQELGGTLSLVAVPTISFTPGLKSEIQVGSEVQQPTINQNGNQGRTWRFFGISLSLNINKYGSVYKTRYKLKLSSPPSLGLSNLNSSESSTILHVNQETKLFNFNIKTKANNSSQMPWISKIPLLGYFVENKSHHILNKRIIAFATIRELKKGQR